VLLLAQRNHHRHAHASNKAFSTAEADLKLTMLGYMQACKQEQLGSRESNQGLSASSASSTGCAQPG
jgi:hypothetical protein